MAIAENNPILISEIDLTPIDGSKNLIYSSAVKEYVDLKLEEAKQYVDD